MKYASKLIASAVAGAAIFAGPMLLAQQQTSTTTNTQLTGQQPVTINKVPSAAQHAIRAQAGTAQVSSVNQATWTGTAYQAIYEKTGKPVYLQVAPDGTILNRTTVRTVKTPLANPTTITFDQLPAPVQGTLTQSAGSSPITSLTQGTWHGTVYQAKLNNAGTTGTNEVLVTADGTPFKQPSALTEAAGAGTTAATQPGTTQSGGTMAFKDLPWTVQKPMLDKTGYAHVTSVTQTKLPDGRTAYVGTYTKDNQLHQITVDDKGAFISDQVTGPAPSQ